jgi:hypothetical protein
MPLSETITLLATLASALQAMRAGRPTEAPAPPAPEVDALTLVTFDLVRTANDDALRKHESACGRLNLVAVLSGGTLLLSAFLGAVSEDAPEGSSPLFIASIVLFAAAVAATIVLRWTLPARRTSHNELSVAPQALRLDAVAQLIEQGRQTERYNLRRAFLLDLAFDALLLTLALQVVLGAVWLIS